jgi:nucleoside-diphosphate-sugar epimerase
MKTILLTGAAGFIGHKTAELLLRDGYRVIGIDNLNDYYDVRLKKHRLDQLIGNSSFEFHEIDIEQKDKLRPLFESNSIDAVMNLAARAGVPYSLENPKAYVSTNLQGSLNFLELANDHEVGKYVLASTSSIYAGEEMPFCEDRSVNSPISPYAATKKAAELMAYSYHFIYGIDISVLRYFTVFGPAGRPDMSIFRFIKWIDEGNPVKLYGDGSQSRDFTYVDDISEGTVKALKKVGYEIINLGGGNNPISLQTVIELIEEKVGKKAVIDNEEFQKTDMKETWADISKAEKLMGWIPRVRFEKGLDQTIAWYKENKSWLSRVKV